jgi:hypothetical protein
MLSANEEYQSTNEELETSKEELQSFNEELHTVNNQLQHKIRELEDATNDLNNLLAGTDTATLFLGTNLCIKWFAPKTQALFSLLSTDVGRPIADFSRKFADENLLADADGIEDADTHRGRSLVRPQAVVSASHASLSNAGQSHRRRRHLVHGHHRQQACRG